MQDDQYDDADLDDLGEDVAFELEQSALQSTQHKPSTQPFRPSFKRVETGNHPSTNHAQANGADSLRGYTRDHDDDYMYDAFDGQEVINLDAQPVARQVRTQRPAKKPIDEVTELEQWRLQRFAGVSHTAQSLRPLSRPQETSRGTPQYQPRANSQGLRRPQSQQSPLPQGSQHDQPVAEDFESLKASIAQLERETARLRAENENANNTIMSRAGEIAIVRANLNKATQENEQRLEALRRSHAEEMAKRGSELDMARKARDRVETSNQFLEHDLAQEADRARSSRRTLKDSTGNAGPKSSKYPSPLGTPKKILKSIPLRDGFDDDEVLALSPSKSRIKTTPKAGSKRKHPDVQDSPTRSLVFDEPMQPLADDSPSRDNGRTIDIGIPIRTKAAIEDGKFKFVESIMDHRQKSRGVRTFEALSRFAFPSAPEIALSSIVNDDLWSIPETSNIDGFRLDFSTKLLELWSKCLHEEYYKPLSDLQQLLRFILAISPSSLSSRLVSRVVAQAQVTVDLVAVSKAKALTNPLVEPPSDELVSCISPLHYLSMLYDIASNCDEEGEKAQTDFWGTVHFDFVLLMLHRTQPMPQILLMLETLHLSVLSSSFGAIALAPETNTINSSLQSRNETSLLDRLTLLLSDTFSPLRLQQTSKSQARAKTWEPPSMRDLLLLRTRTLSLLQAIASTSHGGHSLAVHSHAIARLSAFLHTSLLALYTFSMDEHRSHDDASETGSHGQVTKHINAAVFLLAHLTEAHADVIDIRARLAAVPGASDRHLVALSRIAFSEGATPVEEGITPEAAEWAHRMLDEHLNPEEGEAVVDVFSSGKSMPVDG